MGSNAYIGIGSNIDAYRNCAKVLKELTGSRRLSLLAVSSLYRTSPVSHISQADFLNYVAKVFWTGTPVELLAHLHSVEQLMGRKRDTPLGPRTIDLDILLFEDLVVDRPNLTIPHPRLHERKFTLVPCLEIDPGLVHPTLKKSLATLLTDVGEDQKIEVFAKAGWEQSGGYERESQNS